MGEAEIDGHFEAGKQGVIGSVEVVKMVYQSHRLNEESAPAPHNPSCLGITSSTVLHDMFESVTAESI